MTGWFGLICVALSVVRVFLEGKKALVMCRKVWTPQHPNAERSLLIGLALELVSTDDVSLLHSGNFFDYRLT